MGRKADLAPSAQALSSPHYTLYYCADSKMDVDGEEQEEEEEEEEEDTGLLGTKAQRTAALEQGLEAA